MDTEEIKTRLFELMKSPRFMPMRKRGLAKELEISDQDYRAFRSLLDDMVAQNEIVELKRGKFGLPRDRDDEEMSAPDYSDLSRESDDNNEESDTFREERRGRAHEPRRSQKHQDVIEKAEAIFEKKDRLPKNARTGRIDIKRGGMGFLLSDPPGNDIFIPESDLGGAISGDLVAVELIKRKLSSRRGRDRGWGGAGGSRPVGRVIKIIERAHPRIVGTFHLNRETSRDRGRGDWNKPMPSGRIVPDTRGMFDEIEVLPGDRGDAKDQDKVAIELIEPKNSFIPGARPTARVVKVFGKAGQADADIEAIIENFNIKTEFPEEVLRQAEAISEEIPEEELAQRVDYTRPVTFTIDPADAKDHDDAVAIKAHEDGSHTLYVHIADVSYYLPAGTPMDIEAQDRATSVYIPGKVYPMLPQKLSNNVCSLKEGKLRLTKTVVMHYTRNLTLQSYSIERSYIRSAAFLTYDHVKEALDENKPELVRTPEIFAALKVMRDFAMALRRKRLASGSLDLEIPEAKLLLDEKLEVKGWAKEEHHWAHELIEDMMLAANRTVAEYLVDNELPGLFRVHEDPDPEALKRFVKFVREFGISVSLPLDRMKIKSVLDRIKDKEYAHTIHMALLTSLKQARYSAECHPHFALNFNRYLHFTSPIRRYPDTVVHHALDTRFAPGEKVLPPNTKKRKGDKMGDEYYKQVALLRPLAAHCSQRERQADQAEKEVIKFRQMQYLRKNMKESHPGLITGVRDFGLFVELQDCYVEGVIRLQDLSDDYFEYLENQHMLRGRRTGETFQLGDRVNVRVVDIDLGKKQVDLQIV